jgi:hypothetical protein
MPKSDQLAATTADCAAEGGYVSELRRALALLTEALEIADTQEFPPEIGARVDESIHRMEQELADCELADAIAVVFSKAE